MEIKRFHGRKTEEEKKEARREYSKKYRLEHKKPRELKERKPLQSKEEAKETKRRWRLNNPKKIKEQKKRAYQRLKAKGKVPTRAQLDFGIMKYSDVKHAMQRLNLRIAWRREDFLDWFQAQEKRCYYCGAVLRMRVGLGWSALSLDRLDPDRGYEERNIVLACKRCNMIKGRWFTPEQMKEIATKYLGVDRESERGV